MALGYNRCMQTPGHTTGTINYSDGSTQPVCYVSGKKFLGSKKKKRQNGWIKEQIVGK